MEKLFDTKVSIFGEKIRGTVFMIFSDEYNECVGIQFNAQNGFSGEMWGFDESEVKSISFKNDFENNYIGDFIADMCYLRKISYDVFENEILKENEIPTFYYEGEKW